MKEFTREQKYKCCEELLKQLEADRMNDIEQRNFLISMGLCSYYNNIYYPRGCADDMYIQFPELYKAITKRAEKRDDGFAWSRKNNISYITREKFLKSFMKKFKS